MTTDPRAHYVTSLDRAGLALAAGGALGGMVVAALVAAGGQMAAWALVGGWLLGGLFTMIAIVAVGGPVWLLLHVADRRGPVTAALTGAALALILFVSAQAWSDGDANPPWRLLGALTTSLIVAVAAAAIGWTMQRIAYRRLL